MSAFKNTVQINVINSRGLRPDVYNLKKYILVTYTNVFQSNLKSGQILFF